MLYIILMHISHFMFFANELLLAVCESERCSVTSDSLQPQFILYLF